MLKLQYTMAPDQTMKDIGFEGLTGMEYAGSVKAALMTMRVENPAEEFVRRVKNGDYDHLSDSEYEALLSSVKCVTSLFVDPDAPDKTPYKREMNPLTLLGNAIERLVKLEAAQRRGKGRERR